MKSLHEIYTKIVLESTIGIKKLYHGTDKEHDFSNIGNLQSGTFLAQDKNTAKSFGRYVYEVVLKDNVKILDITTDEGSEWVLSKFDNLYDTYYEEDEEEYLVNDVVVLKNHQDSWECLENTPEVVSTISKYYDGYAATEGGDKTYLIFEPVSDKIKTYKRVI